MTTVRVLVLGLVLSSLAGAAQAARAKAPPPAPKSLIEGIELYLVDAPHSAVEFVVPWMGISRVRGTFEDLRGTIAWDSLDVTRSSVTVVLQSSSITTHFERRDQDLKGPDFFDVQNFPRITFSSREIVREGERYLVRGPLTIRGVTHDVEIPMTFNGHIKDVAGDDRIGFEGGFTLARKDYGIVGPPRFNVVLDKGIVIGEQVEIPVAVEGWKASRRDSLQDPVADSLFRAVVARGPAVVAKQYREARARVAADSLMRVSEGVLNAVGYQLLAQQRTADAIALFQLEVEAFPARAFGYTGLGQAQAMSGSRDAALQALEKAAALDPASTRALELLKRLRGKVEG